MGILLTFLWWGVGLAFGVWYYQTEVDPVGAILVGCWVLTWHFLLSGPVTNLFAKRRNK